MFQNIGPTHARGGGLPPFRLMVQPKNFKFQTVAVAVISRNFQTIMAATYESQEGFPKRLKGPRVLQVAKERSDAFWVSRTLDTVVSIRGQHVFASSILILVL